MTSRSLSSRLVVGSALWTVGLLAVAATVSTAVVRHDMTEVHIFRVHWSLLGFAAAVLLIAAIAQFQKSLSPFDRLRQRLQAVRDGQAARVDGSYPSEVQPLVTDLNGLLEHQATAVARAQAKAGDLAHGLKTPLAVLGQEADRVAADGHKALADTIRQQVARMQRQVDYHLAQARAAASGATLNAHCAVADSADGLARTLQRLHADRGLTIDIDASAHAHAVRVQREDLDEMLGNLLDNACTWARGRVALTAAATATGVRIVVDDDGPGIAPALRQAVLQRGVRADEGGAGSGLGLAIVRDLAGLYGGALVLGDSPLGGLRATLDLPSSSRPGQ